MNNFAVITNPARSHRLAAAVAKRRSKSKANDNSYIA